MEAYGYPPQFPAFVEEVVEEVTSDIPKDKSKGNYYIFSRKKTLTIILII